MAQSREERSLQLGHRPPALVHQPAMHGEGQGEGDAGAAWNSGLAPIPCARTPARFPTHHSTASPPQPSLWLGAEGPGGNRLQGGATCVVPSGEGLA